MRNFRSSKQRKRVITISDKPPAGRAPVVIEQAHAGKRVFRKTVEMLSQEFQERFRRKGLTVTLEEVVESMKEKAPDSLVTALVREWLYQEVLRGVDIIDEQSR